MKGGPGAKLGFPYLGVSDQNTFTAPPPFTVPPDALLNMRPRGKTRAQGTPRPPIALKFNRQIGSGGPGQRAVTVSRAASTADYTVGDRFSTGNPWEQRAAGLLQGQFWMLGPDGVGVGDTPGPQMFRDFYLDVTALDGPGNNRGAACCCWTPDGTKAIFCVNFVDTGAGLRSVAVQCVNQLGIVLWTTYLNTLGTTNWDANTVDADDTYAYVAASDTIHCLNLTTGAVTAKVKSGWESEIIEARVRPDGKIVAVFTGAGFGGGTLPNFPGGAIAIAAGATAFRSGVALYEPNGGASVLTRVQFSSALPASAPMYEAAHGYLRFAEQSAQSPYGTFPGAIGVGATDNSCAVVSSNKGWGPSAAFPPADSGPYISVRKIDASGAILWETDISTVRRNYAGTWGVYHNDVPQAGIPDPTLIACTMDADGNVYVAGYRNAAAATAGFTVAKLASADGAPLAVFNTSGTIRQAGIAIDPTDNTLIVVGDRNDKWTGSGGTALAYMWKLNREDLTLLWAWDILESGSATGVAVNASGQIAYSSDYVTP